LQPTRRIPHRPLLQPAHCTPSMTLPHHACMHAQVYTHTHKTNTHAYTHARTHAHPPFLSSRTPPLPLLTHTTPPTIHTPHPSHSLTPHPWHNPSLPLPYTSHPHTALEQQRAQATFKLAIRPSHCHMMGPRLRPRHTEPELSIAPSHVPASISPTRVKVKAYASLA